MAAAAMDAWAPASVPHSGAIRPTKLFIGGISRRTTTKQLRDHFSKHGRVLDCVAMRQPDGRPRGFAYVTLDSPAAAEYFLREPQLIDGRFVDLKPAVPDASPPSLGGIGRSEGAGGAVHHREPVPRIPAAHLPQQPPYCLWGDNFGLYAGAGGGGAAPVPGGLALPALDGPHHCWLDNQVLDFSSSSPHSMLCDRVLSCMGVLPPPSVPQPGAFPTAGDGFHVHEQEAGRRPGAAAAPRWTQAPAPAVLGKAVLGEVTNLLDDNVDVGNKPKPREHAKVLASINLGGEGGPRPRVAPLTMQLVPPARDVLDDDFFVQEDPEEGCSPTADRAKPAFSTDSGASSAGSGVPSPPTSPATPCDPASLPSVGSASHASGECRRCNFYARGCCRNGADCQFCHFPHDRRQLSRQAKREAKAAQLLSQSAEAPEALGADARSNSKLHGADNKAVLLNGRGSLFMPLGAVLASLRDERDYFNRLQRFLPKNFTVADGGGRSVRSELLHSHFLFSLSVGTEGQGAQYRTVRAANDGFESFVSDDLHSALVDRDEGLEAHQIKVYYYSDILNKVDIFDSLEEDCLLALGGILLVLLIIRIHTKSTPLSLFGLFLVLESIPLGYVFFKQLSGLPKAGVMNCLALFVIIGIGSDLLFVLTDGWRQSEALPKSAATRELENAGPGDDYIVELRRARMQTRLVWLWINRGGSCLTTTVCSATSFLVNLGSVLVPLREFGLFMGLCVLFSLLLQLLMYPLALIALENWQNWRQPVAGNPCAIVAVPPGQFAPPSQSGPGDSEFTKHSFVSRFCGGTWANFIGTHRLKVVALFLVFALVCIISSACLVEVEGGMPDIFPKDHNQVHGKALKDKFESMVDVSVSTATQKAWLCSLEDSRDNFGADRLQTCTDTSHSCGTWASIGYCTSKPGPMGTMCAKTCGLCNYCLVQQCEVEEEPLHEKTAPGRCDCYETSETSQEEEARPFRQSDAEVRFEATVIGLEPGSWPELAPRFSAFFQSAVADAEGGRERSSRYVDGGGAQVRPPLIQQHWRSGTMATWSAFEAPDFSVFTRPNGVSEQDVAEVIRVPMFCYCGGITRCKMSDKAHRSFDYSQTGADRRLEPAFDSSAREEAPGTPAPRIPGVGGRALAPVAYPMAPPRRLAERNAAIVTIVWGLKVKDLGPLDMFVQTDVVQQWEFDPMFDPADPWAQRAMMRMCEELPDSLRVNAASTAPWVQDYDVWLKERRATEFPARDFQTTVASFIESDGDLRQNFLIDDSGRVRAVKADFRLELAETADLGVSLEVMKRWDEHLRARNDAASIRANLAWHTSRLWVRVEAQAGIISSVSVTVLISVCIGFLAMVLFTRNCFLAVLTMFSSALTIIALLFVMVVLMQWPIGAIEAVALIVFLGYLFSFNLHIAHAYIHAPFRASAHGGTNARERHFRCRYALGTMSRSLLGSATTSVGCAIFLLFCTLQFFVKFGIVIIAVTTMSIIYALLFLPALLMLAGPTRSCSCTSICLRKGGPGDEEEPHDDLAEGHAIVPQPEQQYGHHVAPPLGSPPGIRALPLEAVAGAPGRFPPQHGLPRKQVDQHCPGWFGMEPEPDGESSPRIKAAQPAQPPGELPAVPAALEWVGGGSKARSFDVTPVVLDSEVEEEDV